MKQLYKELIKGRYNGKNLYDCDYAEQKMVIAYFLQLTGLMLQVIGEGTSTLIKSTKFIIEYDFDAQKEDSADGQDQLP